MGYAYAVLGAGRQGVASAYDMVRFGDADSVILADVDGNLAARAARRVNELLDSTIVSSAQVDVANEASLTEFLRPVDAVLSAESSSCRYVLPRESATFGSVKT